LNAASKKKIKGKGRTTSLGIFKFWLKKPNWEKKAHVKKKNSGEKKKARGQKKTIQKRAKPL